MGCYSKLDWLSLRLGNVYGPRQYGEGEAGVIAIFTRNLLDKEPCEIYGDGKQTRDYIYVDDVVSAFKKALNIDTKDWEDEKRKINIATGTETSVNDLYQEIRSNLGEEVPVDIEPVHEKAREGDIRRSRLQIKKAAELLAWQPSVNIEEGIKRTVQWFKESEQIEA